MYLLWDRCNNKKNSIVDGLSLEAKSWAEMETLICSKMFQLIFFFNLKGMPYLVFYF